MIGGNISAVLQVKDEGELNKIGEREHQWGDVKRSCGLRLDLCAC